MQVHIRKARIIDPQSGFHNKIADILVEDGIIKNIATTIIAKADTVIEAKGLCVSPGWVDVFADYREPGLEHKETIDSGLSCAAAGGFTDVMMAPGTVPAISSKSIVQYVLQKANGHVVSLHPLGAATQNNDGKDLAEMLDMHSYGAIAFTDGWKPVQHAGLMVKALEYVKAFDGIIMQIPIDGALSGGLMNEGIVSTGMGMPGIPALAETLMVNRDIELARYTASRIHITGITLGGSVELIKKAKAEGVAVTCSVTPYHLSLTDDWLTGYDSMYKVSPPLRTETDRLALIEGLKDGAIDCIASHHRPHEWDAKAKEFEYAADGMAVQESTFNILWDNLREYISVERLVEAMATIPRDIFGLGTGGIIKGGKACLTLFTTEGSHTLTPNNQKSASGNNPYTGKKLSGKVVGIINNGLLYFNK